MVLLLDGFKLKGIFMFIKYFDVNYFCNFCSNIVLRFGSESNLWECGEWVFNLDLFVVFF